MLTKLLFLAVAVISLNVNAQDVMMWDLRSLSDKYQGGVKLKKSDGSLYLLSGSTLKQVREVVNSYSRLSGQYPQIYLKESTSLNAYATEQNGIKMVVINFPMMEVISRDSGMTAAVLGHEMAHLYLNHNQKSVVAEVVGEILGGALEIFLEAVAQRKLGIANLGSRIGNSLSNAASASYSRSQEEDADELSVKWAVSAGYDPTGAERLFSYLERNSASAFSFYSTHPTNPDRIKNVKSVIASYKKQVDPIDEKSTAQELKDSPEIIALNNLIDASTANQSAKTEISKEAVTFIREKQFSKAKNNYEKCASDGDPICIFNLGIMYKLGHGTPKNFEKAAQQFKLAGDKGLALGYISYVELGGETLSNKEIIINLKKAAELGSANAMGALAYLSTITMDSGGKDVLPSNEVLLNYAKVASMRGVASGLVALGTGYKNGANKNLTLAEQNLKLAQEKGAGVAVGELYTLYAIDKHDEIKAQSLKKEIFSKNDSSTLETVAYRLCDRAQRTKGSYVECMDWLNKAALSGGLWSSYSYGLFITLGRSNSLPENSTEGIAWIVASKKLGYPAAVAHYKRLQETYSQDDLDRAEIMATSLLNNQGK